MTPAKPGRFEYRPESIASLRKQLKLSQPVAAKQLGVSVNTLSRWETGATIPDANSLASLYSLGARHGHQPSFFQRRRAQPKPSKGRARLLVFWDFQNAPVVANQIGLFDQRIRATLRLRFPEAADLQFKAFANPAQATATDVLIDHGWRVFESDEDVDADLKAQAKSDGGQRPTDTHLVLIAADGEYTGLVKQLDDRDVSVHVLTVRQKVSARLKQAVGSDRCLALV